MLAWAGQAAFQTESGVEVTEGSFGLQALNTIAITMMMYENDNAQVFSECWNGQIIHGEAGTLSPRRPGYNCAFA